MLGKATTLVKEEAESGEEEEEERWESNKLTKLKTLIGPLQFL